MTHSDAEQASQARCVDLPNDAPEGHYWSWVQAPKSIPSNYRECMTCGRLDASEWQEAETDRLLHEVIEQLPKKMTTPALGGPTEQYWEIVGRNATLAQVIAVLNTYLRGGNHDDSK